MYLRKISLQMLLFVLSIAFAAPCHSAITGAIEQKDEQTVILKVKITSPAPTTAIITLDLPEGAIIQEAKPAYSRLIDKEGKAQWLLTGIKPGKLDIIVRFNKPVEAKGLKALFRYKDVSTGKIIEATNQENK